MSERVKHLRTVSDPMRTDVPSEPLRERGLAGGAWCYLGEQPRVRAALSRLVPDVFQKACCNQLGVQRHEALGLFGLEPLAGTFLCSDEDAVRANDLVVRNVRGFETCKLVQP